MRMGTNQDVGRSDRPAATRLCFLSVLASALAVAATLGASGVAWAEGSRTLFPSTYVGGRAPLNLVNDATAATVVRNRAFIYVYAVQDEYILLGSSNRVDGDISGTMRVYNPQAFGARGNETLPATENFNCNTGLVNLLQSFDGVVAPALPVGWTANNASGTGLWTTTSTSPSSAPNAATVTLPASVSDKRLTSPAFSVSAVPASLSFQRSHNFEVTYDGMVLELSINGGAYVDALAAGGSFAAGGYTGTISWWSGSPIAGRQAWTSNQGAYALTTYNLPGSIGPGDLVSFRWRVGTDNSVNSSFVRIDNISGVNIGAAGGSGPNFFGDPAGAGNITGAILTRAQELAGPRSADNANGAANTWKPCAYRAPVTGIYGVVFTGSATGGADVSVDNIATNPEVLQNQAAAWDITVRSTAASTTDINGRVFSYAWVARTAGNGPARRVNHTLYYITSDGYRYSQRLNNLDPFSYSLYANRSGFLDAGNPLYKDVLGDNFNVTTLNPGLGSGVTAQAPEYPVFLSDVSPGGSNNTQVELVLAALGIPSTPPVPQLNSVSFVGSVSGATTSLGAGGTFTFSTVNTLTYQIVVSRDGVNFDPGNLLNKVLTGTALTGTHNVVWNGLDNAGNLFPVGNGYRYRVEGRNGEAHFPLVDTEGMEFGGPTITKLNGATPGDATVYYDDRGYLTSNNTSVGAVNGHICGAANAQIQPSPNQGLAGVDSSNPNFNGPGLYYRQYPGTTNNDTNCSSNAAVAFGSAKVLDTWALERTPITPGELNIVPAGTQPSLTILKTGVVGPIDLQVTNSTTYTLRVTNNGTAATSGNIVINDDLRAGLSLTGFSGAGWNCVGPVNVVCTYSGPALPVMGGFTEVNITVSIAALTPDANNTGRVSGGGDPVCLPPPAVLSPANAMQCTSTVTIGTVPVTLSYVKASLSNGMLGVEFVTLAEAGTAGFRVLGAKTAGATRQALAPLLPSKGSGLAPQSYTVQVPYDGESAIWIEELTSDGLSKLYGPYTVGVAVGERDVADLIDWPAIRAEQNSFQAAQLAAIRSRGVGSGLEAELRVSNSGLVRFTYEDLLAQGIDWSGQNPQLIELTLGSQVQALKYSGPATLGAGSVFSFLGKAVTDSLYTRTAVYRLRVTTELAKSMSTVFANPVGLDPVLTVRDWAVHAPNRDYDLSARNADPYSAFRLLRSSPSAVSRSEVFTLINLEPTPPTGGKGGPSAPSDQIEVDLWSDFDVPHSVRFVLNGSEIGQLRFNGRDAQTFRTSLSSGLLLNGSNSLQVQLVADTGQDLDSINVESIRVNYLRRLQASDNTLTFELPSDLVVTESSDSIFGDNFSDEGSPACQPVNACTAYRVSGLSATDVVLLRERDGQVEQLTGAWFSGTPGAYEVNFASAARASDRYWIEPAAGRVALTMTPAVSVGDPLDGGPADYLIISHGSLISGLAPFVAARQAEGLSVRVVDVQDLYRYYGSGAVDPVAINLAIADAQQRLNTRYVLLVGGDTRDYLNFGGSNSLSLIPTHYRQVGPVVTFAPTDVPFADVDGDGSLDLAIGRWPVRTGAELSLIIDKTLAYAQADHGGKSLTISDRNEGSVNFGTQLQLVPSGLGPTWSNNPIRLEDYAANATATARNDLVTSINAGKSLMVFMGHGAPLAWTQEGLITSQLLVGGMFNNPSRPTVAWAVGCYGTYFTQPAYNSVAHGLLTRNSSGAAAVFGASTLTEIANDIVWLNALGPRILDERLGDSLRTAQNRVYAAGDAYKDIWLGVSLLGDPALRLRDAP